VSVRAAAAPRSGASTVGIGLRQPHYAALMSGTPPLGFVEVHSENFFADGGASLAVLRQTRTSYPVSLHGVGLGLGSAAGLDEWHLARLARLVEQIEPIRVSDHACFSRASISRGQPVIHANDLLPVAFTDSALTIMASNVMTVQERIGRSILVENICSYVSFSDDSMTEPEFFTQLCKRTGCSMLLDVNNLMVNALNAGAHDSLSACCAFVDALPAGIVGEIHLAGYCETPSLHGESIVIDDHGSHVRPSVWMVYEHALRRFGAIASLIEWDTNIPAFDILLEEALFAQRLVDRQDSTAWSEGAGT
jgi:uncharacterized protein (UPF0276 family)